MFEVKNISEYIDKIYNGTSTITKRDLVSSAKKSLKKTNHDFSREEVSVLFPFIAKQVKMEREGLEYRRVFGGRTLGGVLKDLDQMANMGMFGDYAEKRNQDSEVSYQEGEERFGKTYAWINQLFSSDKLKDDVDKYYDIVKKLGEVHEEFKDGERTFKFNMTADKEFSTPISKTEKSKFLVCSLLNDFITNKCPNFIVESKNTGVQMDLKMPTVYLATILTLRSVVQDDESFNKILKTLSIPLRKSITEGIFNVDNSIVREGAIKLCKARLEQLNSNGGNYNTDVGALFYDLVLEQQLHRSIEKVNDLAVRITNQGSNYPFIIIKDNGISLVRPTEVPDFEDVSTAYAGLKNAGSALGAFAYLDKKIFENKKDKIIDTPEEIAEVMLANLIMLENCGMDEASKKVYQQMFILPLIQSIDSFDAKQIKEIQDTALEDVRELNVLSADRYANYGKSAFKSKKEAEKFRKLIVKELYAQGRKKGLYKEKSLGKSNELREAITLTIGYLNNSKFKGNDFGQNVAEMQIADVDSEAKFAVFDEIYKEYANIISELQKFDAQMLSKTDREKTLKNSEATKEKAKELAQNAVQAGKDAHNTMTR